MNFPADINKMVRPMLAYRQSVLCNESEMMSAEI